MANYSRALFKRMVVVLVSAALMGLLISSSVYSAYLRNKPHTITQPNGTVIHCLISGDEFYNWPHDDNGYVFKLNPDDGYFYYAVKVNGEIVPSAFKVGSVDPSKVGLVPNIFPDQNVIQKARATLFAVPAGTPPANAPHKGTINNIVISIRFSDDSEYTEPISAYNQVFNDVGPTANSLHEYFWESSYNQLTVSTTFYPVPTTQYVASYQDSHPRNYYLPYSGSNPTGYTESNRTSREHTLLANATNAVKAGIPADLDVDGDNDGYVDNVCYIIKGDPSDWATLLWPHKWNLYTQSVIINGAEINEYNFQLSSWIECGVLCHEMTHSLGSPDLYRYSYQPPDPIGPWDLMCMDSDPPQYTDAYMKWKYMEWISEIPEITAPGTYTLNPLTSATNNCYKIASTNSITEFFVVEYRKKMGTFESQLPGSGLLVYRINPITDGNAGGPPDEVYVYRPGGTLTADGNINSAFFSSDAGRTAINDTTSPSCFLSNGQPGGLKISNITSAGSTISFDVSFECSPPTLSPTSGSFMGSATVTVTCPSGAQGEVHYTTNGNDPTLKDPFVTSGAKINLFQSGTLKARTFKTGFTPSKIVSGTYTVTNMSVPTLKALKDGSDVAFGDKVITMAFADSFYVEADNKGNGIWVKKTAHGLTPQMRVKVIGKIQTDSTSGERYISATTTAQTGSAVVTPLIFRTKDVGGKSWMYNSTTGAGQAGISGSYGLNNIGLYIRVAGKPRYIDSSTFAVNDGSKRELTCYAPAGWVIDPNWEHVTLTGASSCTRTGDGTLSPCLKIDPDTDVFLDTGGMITGRVEQESFSTQNLITESLHPYRANSDLTWTITGPSDALQTRLFFSKIQLETGKDTLTVLDASNNIIQTYDNSTALYNQWTPYVSGNVVKLHLVSNGTTQNYGFQMTKYEVQHPNIGLPGAKVTLAPGGQTFTTGTDGVYYFRRLSTGNYTVTPSAAGMAFSPVNLAGPVQFGQYVHDMTFIKQ